MRRMQRGKLRDTIESTYVEILHNYEIIVCPGPSCCSGLNKCRFAVVISTREEIDSRQNSAIVPAFECAHCSDVLSVPFDHVPPNVALYYLFFVLAASPLIMLERRILMQMFYEDKTKQKKWRILARGAINAGTLRTIPNFVGIPIFR